MKYKVGDKVKVREDLNLDDTYGSEEAVEEMLLFAGKIVTIQELDYWNSGYYIKECSYRWKWTDEMFKDVNSKKKFEISRISDVSIYPISTKKCDCDKCHVERINKLFQQINDITAMYIDQIQTRENRLVVESLVEEIKMAINKTM